MAKSTGNAGSLFYGMTLDPSDFKKKLKATAKFSKVQGQKITDTFRSIARGGAIAAGAFTAVAAGLSLLTKETAEAANSQLILADSIGSTVTELDALVFTANALGVETGMTIDKMREAGGMDAFKDIADQVATAGTATEQLAKAQELLGNEGLKLLPILQLGSSGLSQFKQQAIETGNALPVDKVARLVVAWQQYESLMQTLSGLQKRLSATLAEPVGILFAGLEKLASLLSGKLIDGAKTWAIFMTDAIPVVAQNVFSLTSGFITWFNTASQGLMMVTEALFGLKSEGKSTFSVFQLMGDLLATLPNQLVIIAKKIGASILGTFQTIGNLIFRVATEPVLFALKMIDKLAQKFFKMELFPDLAKETKNVREQFSLDLFDNVSNLWEEGEILDIRGLEKENDRIIADRVDEEEKFNKELKLTLDKMKGNFNKLSDGLGKGGASIAKAVTSAISATERRAGLLGRGSQEESSVRNQSQARIDIAKQQLRYQKETAKALQGLKTG